MGRTSLKYSLLTFSVITTMVVNTPVSSNMTVFDPTVHAELSTILAESEQQVALLQEKLDKATEQLQRVNEISQAAQSTIDAIGNAASITLPSINLNKIASQLKKDMQCLMPDLDGLMPSINFQELEFGSICEASNAYQSSLFAEWSDKEESENGESFTRNEIIERQDAVRDRRQALLQDVVVKGLGQGDIGNQASTELLEATEELKQSAEAADTMNKRLAVLIQGQIMQTQATAQTNQLLSQLVKIQAMTAMQIGLPLDATLSALSSSEDEAEEAQ